jgi:hypothetical protein
MNDTQTQIERLIELAIVQRTELKQLVEQLPQLREHLNAEVERTIEEVEPQLRAELEDWTTKQTIDQTAKLGAALEAKITELSKALEVSTQARYNAIIAERAKSANLAEQAEAKIAEHAAKLPSAVKEIVSAELSRFPRAGEIDQMRKEFAEPRGLNPRGKWSPDETYNRLDLVAYNGDSYVSNRDGNAERPSRTSAEWTLSAARGAGGGGGGITSLNDVLNAPTSGQIIGSENGQYVPKTLAAGANITITETANTITIIGDEGQISLSDGTAGAPSLHFTSDTDTGVYRPGANTLGISVSGTQIAYFDEDGLTIPNAGVAAGGSFHAANGNANNPSHSFTSDQDTGFFRHATNQIGVSTNGVASLIFTQNAGELLGHTGVSVTFGAGSSGATIALGQGTNGGVTITPKGSGTAVVNGTTIPASKTLVVTTDKLSALAATSSSELAGVISDETGTGSLVFANTPTLVTPNIGAATGTSVNLSSNATVGGTLTVSGTGNSSVAGKLFVGTLAGGDATYRGDVALLQAGSAAAGNGGLEWKVDAGGSGYGYRKLAVFDGVSAYNLTLQSRSNSASWTTVQTITPGGSMTVSSTTASTSTSTGALVVGNGTSGGLGVGGAINAGGNIKSSVSASGASGGVLLAENTAAAATGNQASVFFPTSTGASTYWQLIGRQNSATANDQTLRVVFGGVAQHTYFNASDLSVQSGITLKVLDSTASTSTSTGALVVSGGVGVAGAINAGGNLTVSGTGTSAFSGPVTISKSQAAAYTSLTIQNGNASGYSQLNMISGSNTASINYAPGVFFKISIPSADSFQVSTNNITALTITSAQQVQVNATTASTSTSTGALVVSGGVGVAGAIYAGGLINASGSGSFSTTTDRGGLTLNFPAAPTGSNGPAATFKTWTNTASLIDAGRIASIITDGSASYASKLEFSVANAGSLTTALTIENNSNATFAGGIKTVAPTSGTAQFWELGEAATVSPTSPNRTLRVEIAGTVYFIHAKTTND